MINLTMKTEDYTLYIYNFLIACFVYFITNFVWPKILEGGVINVLKIFILKQQTFSDLTKDIDELEIGLKTLYKRYLYYVTLNMDEYYCHKKISIILKKMYLEKKIVYMAKKMENLAGVKEQLNIVSNELIEKKEKVMDPVNIGDIESGEDDSNSKSFDLDELKKFVNKVNSGVVGDSNIEIEII